MWQKQWERIEIKWMKNLDCLYRMLNDLSDNFIKELDSFIIFIRHPLRKKRRNTRKYEKMQIRETDGEWETKQHL